MNITPTARELAERIERLDELGRRGLAELIQSALDESANKASLDLWYPIKEEIRQFNAEISTLRAELLRLREIVSAEDAASIDAALNSK